MGGSGRCIGFITTFCLLVLFLKSAPQPIIERSFALARFTTKNSLEQLHSATLSQRLHENKPLGAKLHASALALAAHRLTIRAIGAITFLALVPYSLRTVH
jgi:hypothetical protein